MNFKSINPLVLLTMPFLCSFKAVVSQTDPSNTTDCISGPSKWYRGTRNVTKSGLPCQRWDVDKPHLVSKKPEDGGHHNHCRNPDNGLTGAWCYTTDHDIKWELCDLPKCHDDSMLIFSRNQLGGDSVIGTIPVDPEVGFNYRDTHRVIYNTSESGEESFIWSVEADKRGERIFFTDYRGNFLIELSMKTNETTKHLIGMCHGIEQLAYDWTSGILCWTDSEKRWIMASVTKSFEKMVKIYKNESITPYGLALHAVKRKLFFSTYDSGYSSIKVADMDGGNVTDLFTSPNIKTVPNMAVDYTDDRLYWVNNKNLRTYIESCKLDGSNKTTIYARPVGRFWGIAAYMETIFLADQIGYYDSNRGRFYRLWILSKSGTPRNSYKYLSKSKSVSIYSTNEEYIPKEEVTSKPCLSHPCSHVCIPLLGDKYSCKCFPGYYKAGKTKCVQDFYKDNFVIMGDLVQKKIFQVPINDDINRYTNLPIPTNFDEGVTTISLDPAKKVLYWSNFDTTTIYKSKFNGSSSGPFLTGKHARCMEVDPSTGNVYFADDDSSYIYVVDSSGNYSKVLYKPTDSSVALYDVEDITLDFDNRHIYWTAIDAPIDGQSDFNAMGVVMRMGFDGSNKEVVFHNIITPRAITVDHERKLLFLMSNGNILYEVPLSQLTSVTGSLPAQRKRYDISSFSRNNPVVDLLVLGDYSYMVGKIGYRIVKVNFKDSPDYPADFGSTDFFQPRFLVMYNSTYQKRFSSQAEECKTMGCQELCLQRPLGRPTCGCSSGYKVSTLNPKTCIHSSTDDFPPSYGITCPRDISVNYMFCQPYVTLPKWNPPVWTDDITPADDLTTTVPTIRSEYTVGRHVFQYTATDEAGNRGTCSFTVTVNRVICKIKVPPRQYNLSISSPRCEDGDIVHAIKCKDRRMLVRHGSSLNKTLPNVCLSTIEWSITDYSQLSCELPQVIEDFDDTPSPTPWHGKATKAPTTEATTLASTLTTTTTKIPDTPKATTKLPVVKPSKRPSTNVPTKPTKPSSKPTITTQKTKPPATTLRTTTLKTEGGNTTMDKPGNGTNLKGSLSSNSAATAAGMSSSIVAAIVVVILLVVVLAVAGFIYARKKNIIPAGVSLNSVSMMWNKANDQGLTKNDNYEQFY